MRTPMLWLASLPGQYSPSGLYFFQDNTIKLLGAIAVVFAVAVVPFFSVMIASCSKLHYDCCEAYCLHG
jgi:hypothetical protein